MNALCQVHPKKITLEVGDGFTLLTSYGTHLHIIVAESSPEDSASIMLVYLSSVDSDYKDRTTIIEIGEHPFVTRSSWVRYQNILVASRADVEKIVVKHFGKVDPKLLQGIQDGLEASDFSSNGNKQLYHQWKMDSLYSKL